MAADKRVGQRFPEHYQMHLQDSQVLLACMTKGGSSSQAINREPRASIPDVVGANVRGYDGFIRSKSNPADDRTRSQPIRRPKRDPPDWWRKAGAGDYEEFDKFLKEFVPEEESILD